MGETRQDKCDRMVTADPRALLADPMGSAASPMAEILVFWGLQAPCWAELGERGSCLVGSKEFKRVQKSSKMLNFRFCVVVLESTKLLKTWVSVPPVGSMCTQQALNMLGPDANLKECSSPSRGWPSNIPVHPVSVPGWGWSWGWEGRGGTADSVWVVCMRSMNRPLGQSCSTLISLWCRLSFFW